jgi:hypothetical protein
MLTRLTLAQAELIAVKGRSRAALLAAQLECKLPPFSVPIPPIDRCHFLSVAELFFCCVLIFGFQCFAKHFI